MRLLDKHSRHLFVTNLLILLLGGFFAFYLFSYIMDRNILETLRERQELVRAQLSVSDSIYVYQRFSGHVFSIRQLPDGHPTAERISDTIIYDPIQHSKSLFRQLTFGETIRGQPYLITVRRPLIDRIEILHGILLLIFLLIMMLVAALYFANRMVSKQLWQPFYATLAQLRHYQIDDIPSIQFPKTDITEFTELTQVLKRLIEQIQADYYALKEYTENTTHEIQTPLAIIQSKLDLLLHENNLSLTQLQLINAANQAVGRLARIKEALLLLVRIKNRQYVNAEPIPLAPLVKSRLAYFQELLQMRTLSVREQLDEKSTLVINLVLAEVLIDNLISNAIKHNTAGGTVIAKLTTTHLIFQNTGEAPRVPTAAFFDRFVKSDPHSKSLGLGLAIVKAICDINGLGVAYQYTNGLHKITISFSTTDSLQNFSVRTESRN